MFVGKRNRLTKRGKERAWAIASEAYSAAVQAKGSFLVEADQPIVMDLVEQNKPKVIPPIVWQIVLSYIAQLIIQWIVEQYLNPPEMPDNLLGEDEE